MLEATCIYSLSPLNNTKSDQQNLIWGSQVLFISWHNSPHGKRDLMIIMPCTYLTETGKKGNRWSLATIRVGKWPELSWQRPPSPTQKRLPFQVAQSPVTISCVPHELFWPFHCCNPVSLYQCFPYMLAKIIWQF